MKQLLPLIILTAISTQVLANPLPSQTLSPATTQDWQYGEQKGDLPNFHEVHPYLYRGGQPSSAGLKKLKSIGISTIIDLRGNPEMVYNESQEAKALGMQTINLPMTSQAPTKEQVNQFFQAVEDAQAGKSKGPVFVHCAHGSDRTGCLVGIWRVTHEGWDYDTTYQEMRKYYFTPKFTKLSGAVKAYAQAKPDGDAH